MRLHFNNAAEGVLEGALGGLVGTALMMQGMERFAHKLPEPIRPPTMKGDPAEVLMRKAEKLARLRMRGRAREVVTTGMRWAYGTSWGTLLGFAAPFLKTWPQAISAGAAMGTVSWAATYGGFLPAAGITEPIYKQRPGGVASSLLSHVVFGIAAVVPMFGAKRLLAPRPVRGVRRVQRILRRAMSQAF
jgi:hypothetical protein